MLRRGENICRRSFPRTKNGNTNTHISLLHHFPNIFFKQYSFTSVLVTSHSVAFFVANALQRSGSVLFVQEEMFCVASASASVHPDSISGNA